MASTSTSTSSTAGTSGSTSAAKSGDQDLKFTITVNCTLDGERRAVSYTVFKRTLISQVFDSSVQFFGLDPAQVVLVVKSRVALHHKCVEDYRLGDKSFLDLVHIKEEPTVELHLRDQNGVKRLLPAAIYHPLSDVVKVFCKQLNEEVGFSDLYHGGIALDLDASPASTGLKNGDQLFCYCYKATCRQFWQNSGTQPEQAPSQLRFFKFYFSDWKYGYKTFPIFRHDVHTPMSVVVSTFCQWRGLDPQHTGFIYSYTYKQLHPEDTPISRSLTDGDTILAYNRQELQGRFWDAILAGDVARVSALLDEGAEISTRLGAEDWGKHPLHAAAASSNMEVVQLLLARGASPNTLDYASDPPLWHAVEHGLVDMVLLLLDNKSMSSDLNHNSSNEVVVVKPKEGKGAASYAALPHAARRGHIPVLQALLRRGANPWSSDSDGYSAWDYALDHAKPPALVQVLLENDLTFAKQQQHFQAQYGRLCAMLKRTQRYPALGCPCRTCNSMVEIRAPESEASRSLRDQIGCVSLVRAVQAGGPACVEVMELLLKHGALIDGQDFDGRTALHQAIRYNRPSEAKWLIGHGAHLDVPDFEGLLPLHQVGCSGFVDICRLLVEAGAPLNLHTIKYVAQEALDAQARKQDPGSKKAKRKQLDVSGLTTIGGNSALALAIRHGHVGIVECLLSMGAVFDLKNAADSSAFHAALDKGSAAIAGLLLQYINRKPGATATLPSSGSSTAAKASASKVSSALVKAPAKQKADREREAKERDAAKEKEREARKAKEAAKSAATAAATVATAAAGAGEDGLAAGGLGAGDGSASGSGGGGAEGGVVIVSPAMEPPVAVDAGAGLREMVLRERERLRQQMGLGSATSDSTKLPISTVSSIASQLFAPKPQPPPKPVAPALPPAVVPAPKPAAPPIVTPAAAPPDTAPVVGLAGAGVAENTSAASGVGSVTKPVTGSGSEASVSALPAAAALPTTASAGAALSASAGSAASVSAATSTPLSAPVKEADKPQSAAAAAGASAAVPAAKGEPQPVAKQAESSTSTDMLGNTMRAISTSNAYVPASPSKALAASNANAGSTSKASTSTTNAKAKAGPAAATASKDRAAADKAVTAAAMAAAQAQEEAKPTIPLKPAGQIKLLHLASTPKTATAASAASAGQAQVPDAVPNSIADMHAEGASPNVLTSPRAAAAAAKGKKGRQLVPVGGKATADDASALANGNMASSSRHGQRHAGQIGGSAPSTPARHPHVAVHAEAAGPSPAGRGAARPPPGFTPAAAAPAPAAQPVMQTSQGKAGGGEGHEHGSTGLPDFNTLESMVLSVVGEEGAGNDEGVSMHQQHQMQQGMTHHAFEAMQAALAQQPGQHQQHQHQHQQPLWGMPGASPNVGLGLGGLSGTPKQHRGGLGVPSTSSMQQAIPSKHSQPSLSGGLDQLQGDAPGSLQGVGTRLGTGLGLGGLGPDPSAVCGNGGHVMGHLSRQGSSMPGWGDDSAAAGGSNSQGTNANSNVTHTSGGQLGGVGLGGLGVGESVQGVTQQGSSLGMAPGMRRLGSQPSLSLFGEPFWGEPKPLGSQGAAESDGLGDGWSAAAIHNAATAAGLSSMGNADSMAGAGVGESPWGASNSVWGQSTLASVSGPGSQHFGSGDGMMDVLGPSGTSGAGGFGGFGLGGGGLLRPNSGHGSGLGASSRQTPDLQSSPAPAQQQPAAASQHLASALQPPQQQELEPLPQLPASLFDDIDDLMMPNGSGMQGGIDSSAHAGAHGQGQGMYQHHMMDVQGGGGMLGPGGMHAGHHAGRMTPKGVQSPAFRGPTTMYPHHPRGSGQGDGAAPPPPPAATRPLVPGQNPAAAPYVSQQHVQHTHALQAAGMAIGSLSAAAAAGAQGPGLAPGAAPFVNRPYGGYAGPGQQGGFNEWPNPGAYNSFGAGMHIPMVIGAGNVGGFQAAPGAGAMAGQTGPMGQQAGGPGNMYGWLGPQQPPLQAQQVAAGAQGPASKHVPLGVMSSSGGAAGGGGRMGVPGQADAGGGLKGRGHAHGVRAGVGGRHGGGDVWEHDGSGGHNGRGPAASGPKHGRK